MMLQAINTTQSPYALAQENLDNIIEFLKKQPDVKDLGSLITSLEASVNLRNDDLLENTASVKATDFQHSLHMKTPSLKWEAGEHDDDEVGTPLPNYHGNSAHHHSLALKAGPCKWEAGEHDDMEVEVPLLDLEEMRRREQRKVERRERMREEAMRERAKRELEREVASATVTTMNTLINIGTFGLGGLLGLTVQHAAIAKAIPTTGYGASLGVSFFESGEHDDEEVTILGETAPNKNLLVLPNGIQLTYGEIIAFAGDFYGIPEWPICEGTSGTSYESRFMDAFNTLGRGDVASIRKELEQIRYILMIEKNSVATVLGKGNPSIPTVLDDKKTYNQPSDVYKYHGLWFTIQYDTILGGYWVRGIPVRLGRMMKLAENNPDHFQPYSRKVWEVGHKLALQKAAEAKSVFKTGMEEGVKLLHEAYAISAFSCHFLTDSFAGGHIRVPRKELPAVVTPARVGNLLVHDQHDEDGKFGINVINDDKERWRCFGDGTLYDEKSKENKKLVRGVVQECVNQVWYEFRGEPHGNANDVLRKIPKVDLTRPNNFPLFTAQSENGKIKVFRREDVNDLSDSRKTENWWGWSTWTMLQKYDPKNSVVG